MSTTPESVQKMLNSEDFGDRLSGVNQLRQLETATAFNMVQAAIGDENARVRYSAVSLMDSLGHQDLQTSLQLLRDRLLNDPEPDVQAAAADALGALKLSDAFEDMQRLYQESSEWLVQFSIIAALGELGDSRGLELLRDALASENPLVKTAAIGSFGELSDPRAVSLLSPYVSDPDWQVRSRVVQALSRIGGAEARSLLEQLADDEAEQVAQEATNSLASA
ncbi:MAG: phycocyanin alpha phycocyanobilin lyase [Cyanobacteria bacterium QS_7_48_42]|nr:MAG: phycocyanin alpha phycocyanobilin lyase [Cyanobacteria bacterium QS_3_48_167]PSO99782.1 MAG: phycocyanin alpha phycocyanobilin lyase [Cyanobacteria bacterium QS_7_48_42]PSP16730.1 MAG: phycocyanin alpha phycocyanobilin lyase [Cyanobacteria bacterium SW_5_48_44]PSP22958.1 MAG: phycocyanin alpha phycocyanobilin lyase [Cyanobacteria bacterium SW_8_48_13]